MAPVLILLTVAGLMAVLQWNLVQAAERIRRRKS